MADSQSYADSSGFMSPDSPAARRRLFEAMMSQRQRGPVQHWAQGVGRVAEAMVGGYGAYQAEQDERKSFNDLGDILGGTLGGGAPTSPAPSATSPSAAPPSAASSPAAAVPLAMGSPRDPRSVRTNNPGAIESGPFAQRAGATGSDGRYAIFPDMGAGYGAMDRLLGSYGQQGRNTVASIIERWAPRTVDNNSTDRYVANVARDVGVDPNAPIPAEMMPRVAEAMAAYEAGRPVPRPQGGGGSVPLPMQLGGPSPSDTGAVAGGAPPAAPQGGAPPPIDFRGAGLPELAPNATLPPPQPAAPISPRPPAAGMPPTLMQEAQPAPPAGATTAGGLGPPSSLPPMSGPMPQPTGVPGMSSAGPMPPPAPAGPPAAAQPPAAQGPMPANDVIRRLLTSRNPQAIQFGMQLYRDTIRRGPTADYDFQFHEGNVYRTNKRTGQIDQVAGTGQQRPPEAIRTQGIKADQAYSNLTTALDRYEQTVGRTGRNLFSGQETDEVSQARTNIQLQLKELYNLGVLNGPDLALMEQMLPDPTVGLGTLGFGGSPSNVWSDPAARTKAAVARLKEMLRGIRNNAVAPMGTPPVGGADGFSIRRLP